MRYSSYLLITLVIVLYSQVGFAQTSKNTSTPEKDFELFWTIFKDNYAFFQLKGVNWDSSYIKYRPLINRKTKEKELLSIFQQMVAPLNDGHITLSKGDDVFFKVSKPSYFRQEFKGLEKAFWQTAYQNLEQNSFSPLKGIGPLFKDEHLYYTSSSNDIGYIRISRCFATIESLFDDDKEAADTLLMTKLLDEALTSLAHTSSLIIDIRNNGGGHGGIELASRFIKQRTLTHYKAIRQKGDLNTFTKPEPIYISPNSGIQYLKPIVILTNDKTASSAEDFTLSLYLQDHITTIGANTSGMLSDMFSGELSNAVSFTLSNQVYYATNHEMLEDKGIPVTIPVVHSKAHLEKKVDPVILKAINVLTRAKEIGN